MLWEFEDLLFQLGAAIDITQACTGHMVSGRRSEFFFCLSWSGENRDGSASSFGIYEQSSKFFSRSKRGLAVSGERRR